MAKNLLGHLKIGFEIGAFNRPCIATIDPMPAPTVFVSGVASSPLTNIGCLQGRGEVVKAALFTTMSNMLGSKKNFGGMEMSICTSILTRFVGSFCICRTLREANLCTMGSTGSTSMASASLESEDIFKNSTPSTGNGHWGTLCNERVRVCSFLGCF